MTAPLVFTDIETTGLDMLRRRAWEIALIRREPNGDEARLHMMIGDVSLTDAEPMALGVGKFWERHPGFGNDPMGLYPTKQRIAQPGHPSIVPEAVAAKAVVYMFRDGAHMVGACPWFDAITLELMLRENSLTPNWHYHLIDVESMMLGYLGDDAQVPWRSRDMAAKLGIVTDETTMHTAMADAEFAKNVYDAITL